MKYKNPVSKGYFYTFKYFPQDWHVWGGCGCDCAVRLWTQDLINTGHVLHQWAIFQTDSVNFTLRYSPFKSLDFLIYLIFLKIFKIHTYIYIYKIGYLILDRHGVLFEYICTSYTYI